jgi:hypothetical protein
VGTFVGAPVGCGVGIIVGDLVVGDPVGFFVGVVVGDLLGLFVGAAVG